MSDAGVEMESGGSPLVQFPADYQRVLYQRLQRFFFRSVHAPCTILARPTPDDSRNHTRFLSVEFSLERRLINARAGGAVETRPIRFENVSWKFSAFTYSRKVYK